MVHIILIFVNSFKKYILIRVNVQYRLLTESSNKEVFDDNKTRKHQPQSDYNKDKNKINQLKPNICFNLPYNSNL